MLELFARNEGKLVGMLTTVKEISNVIGMNFGLYKCTKLSFEIENLRQIAFIELDIDTSIKQLDPEESYRYLEIKKGDGIQYTIKKKYERSITEEFDTY